MVETGTPMIPVIFTCPRPWDVILRLTFCFLGRMQGRARSVLLSIDRHGDFPSFLLFFYGTKKTRSLLHHLPSLQAIRGSF